MNAYILLLLTEMPCVPIFENGSYQLDKIHISTRNIHDKLINTVDAVGFCVLQYVGIYKQCFNIRFYANILLLNY